MKKEVKVFEAGNGFPDNGDMVQIDGECYMVAECGSYIHTGTGANYIYANVRPCPDFPAEIFPCDCKFS